MDLVSLFTNIADAIRGKKGTEDKIRAVDFASEIESIETGGGSSELISKDVDFIDYDGTLLYSYTLEEIQNMTELPPLPTQPGLICQEWNWSLEDIKAHNRRLIVGATYITDDGKTRLYINLPYERNLNIDICFRQMIANGVEVDWGDGSPTETYEDYGFSVITIASHSYSKTGEYVITLNTANNSNVELGNGSSNYTIFNKPYSEYTEDRIFLRRVEIGKNVTGTRQYAFANFVYLKHFTMPNNFTNTASGMCRSCIRLKGIVIPKTNTSLGGYLFYESGLELVSLPNGVTMTGDEIFSNCNLSEIILPNTVKNLNSRSVSGNKRIEEVVVPGSVSGMATNSLIGLNGLKKLVLSQGLSIIGQYMLATSYSLSEVHLPSTVKTIYKNAFNGNKHIFRYYFTEHTEIPTLSDINAFTGIPSDCQIIVPDALYDEWIAATNWSNYADYIVKVSEVA